MAYEGGMATTKYILICTPGHSGSTLLDIILGGNKQAASLGEMSHLSKNIALNTVCSCGNPIKKCEFWGEVFRHLEEISGHDLLTNPYAFELGQPLSVDVIDKQQQTARYKFKRYFQLSCVYIKQRFGLVISRNMLAAHDKIIENTFAVYDAVRKTSDRSTIIDSSKGYMRAVDLYRKRPESTKIVLLTRDGRGFAFSHKKRGRSFRRAVKNWKKFYIRSLPLFKRHVNEDGLLAIKYEDITAAPEEKIRLICDFVDLKFDLPMLDFTKSKHHILNGNNMRFQKSSSITKDEKWLSGLDDEEMHYFERSAGKINYLLGYKDKQ